MIEKAGALLDRLAAVRELSVARLAADLGEPRSSIYRLLAALQRLEFVEPGSTRGAYRLGVKLLSLGSAVQARFDERAAALPEMEALHRQTGETIFLCVRHGFQAVCIERIEGERVQSLALRLGGSLPLHVGAAPRVLLAFEPDELWQEYVGGWEPERLTAKTLVSRRALFAALEEIRELGYAISDEDVTAGIAAIGAPVRDYSGRVCAALSISGTRPLILGNVRDVTEKTVAAADAASRSLGYRPAAG